MCVCVCVGVCTLNGVPKAHVGQSVHGFRLVLREAHNQLHISCRGESRHAVWIMVARITQQWTLPSSVTQCLSAVVFLWLGADHLQTHTRVQKLMHLVSHCGVKVQISVEVHSSIWAWWNGSHTGMLTSMKQADVCYLFWSVSMDIISEDKWHDVNPAEESDHWSKYNLLQYFVTLNNIKLLSFIHFLGRAYKASEVGFFALIPYVGWITWGWILKKLCVCDQICNFFGLRV